MDSDDLSIKEKSWRNNFGILHDTKIARHIKLKLDMNPHLDKDYFISRKVKLRVKKRP